MIRKTIIVVLTAAALLVCTTWPLSYLAPIRLTFGESPRRSLEAECRKGLAMFEFARPVDAATFRQLSKRPYSVVAGFAYGSEPLLWRGGGSGWDPPVHMQIRRFYAPLWAPFVLFAGYPTVAFLRGPARRYRRRRKGLCAECGYDLTGNVSGVCPECGMGVQDF
jgi:hypothetical protein